MFYVLPTARASAKADTMGLPKDYFEQAQTSLRILYPNPPLDMTIHVESFPKGKKQLYKVQYEKKSDLPSFAAINEFDSFYNLFEEYGGVDFAWRSSAFAQKVSTQVYRIPTIFAETIGLWIFNRVFRKARFEQAQAVKENCIAFTDHWLKTAELRPETMDWCSPPPAIIMAGELRQWHRFQHKAEQKISLRTDAAVTDLQLELPNLLTELEALTHDAQLRQDGIDPFSFIGTPTQKSLRVKERIRIGDSWKAQIVFTHLVKMLPEMPVEFDPVGYRR